MNPAANHVNADCAHAAAIMDEYRNLEAHEAYYLKNDVRFERLGPLAPDTEEILRTASLALRVAAKPTDG